MRAERRGLRVLAVALAGWLLLGSCGDAGGAYVSFPAYGVGSAREPFSVGAWTVTLTRAEIAFGPAYFCATASSNAELCGEAIAEMRSSATIDALDPTPRRIGTIEAITGEIRSAMFDYGISWHLPDPAPRPTEGAIDGHSAIFEGSASHVEGRTIRFVAAIDVVPRLQGALSVFGVRMRHAIASANDALVVRIDPNALWARVDFDALAAIGDDPVVIRPGTQAWNALVIAMTSAALPSFRWGHDATSE
jgi:hypothetical protein